MFLLSGDLRITTDWHPCNSYVSSICVHLIYTGHACIEQNISPTNKCARGSKPFPFPSFDLASNCVHPRHYPYRFGLRVLRILPQLQADGCKAFPPMPETFDPLEWYKTQMFDDHWGDANIAECIWYIKGNKYLNIPFEWKPHLFAE